MSKWCRVLLHALLLLSPLAVHATADNEAFEQGVAAFRAGDYEQAKEAFTRAGRLGLETASLHYNLGVTCYRLGQYGAARRHLRKLTGHDAWRPLALYNLGLISEKQNRPHQARALFRDAARLATERGDHRLAGLARRLTDADHGGPDELYLALALGDDSNPTYTPEERPVTEGGRDRFLELYLDMSHVVDQRWRLGGSLYARRYRDTEPADDTLAEVEFGRLATAAYWRVDAGVQVSTFRVDAEPFQRRAGFYARARRPLGSRRSLALALSWERVHASDAYAYLDGWEGVSELAWYSPIAGLDMKLAYELTLNRRQDLETEAGFESFSPVRQEIELRLSRALTAVTNMGLGLEYEYARYADEHHLDGEKIRRKDHSGSLFLRLRHRLWSTGALYGEAGVEDRDSTLNLYRYRRTIFRLGVEYQY